jgi:hypothetical protein
MGLARIIDIVNVLSLGLMDRDFVSCRHARQKELSWAVESAPAFRVGYATRWGAGAFLI